ncbi:tellurium resistance protein [Phaeovulum sp. W22_SRMD_FR3]|uniref:SLAC1 family transporter n=1 Tax=Phaeovulum sp. W22_SRMD_FR3 TaxID=3240274 RepID=UPI003F95CC2A
MPFTAPKPQPRGFARRVPPAIFPSLLGLLGLGLAWRRAAPDFGLPGGIADLALGMISAVFCFGILAYTAKFMRRPAAVAEDLKILPGRAGLSTMAMGIYLMAAVLAPWLPGLSPAILFLGLAVHLVLIALMLGDLVEAPAEQRRVTPVMHLSYVGPIVGAQMALALGYSALAAAIFWITLPVALLIWYRSARQALRERVPAPLRPLLAIHLSPAALMGTVSLGLGYQTLALAFAVLAALILTALVLGARWLLAAGFSPFWGALTFPLAATATLWLALGGALGSGAWRGAGDGALIAATLIIPPIAVRVLQLWAKGTLAIKTNAATA